MAIQIKLHTFHAEPHEEQTHWVDAKGTNVYPLDILLKYFWFAPTPDFADGEAYEIRFV